MLVVRSALALLGMVVGGNIPASTCLNSICTVFLSAREGYIEKGAYCWSSWASVSSQAELSMHEKLCCIDARTRPVAAIGNTRTSRMALEHSIADPSKRRLTPYSRASLQATGDRADPGLLVGAA